MKKEIKEGIQTTTVYNNLFQLQANCTVQQNSPLAREPRSSFFKKKHADDLKTRRFWLVGAVRNCQ
jgi:hypothetical protein